MPPMPNREHQDLEGSLYHWLSLHWAGPQGNRVFPPVNVASVGGWPNDYRTADLVLLTPDRFHIDNNEYFEGAPTVAVEIRSPGDESYEKLDFYAELGVPEVWIIDRDSKQPELYSLSGQGYQRLPAETDGWVASPATGVRLRAEPGPKLGVQMGNDPATHQRLPATP